MKKTSESIAQENQGFVEHLTELRKRLINSIAALIICSCICYYYSEKLFDVLRRPIVPFLKGGGLIFTSPMEKFMAHIQVSISAGIIFACPIVIYQIWKFISPGLYQNEKRYTLGFILSGTFLFVSGVLFAYFLVYPLAFDYLMKFGGTQDTPMITIESYLNFMTITTLMFGLSFELPLVIVILGMIGLISQKFLREKRRYAIVLLSVISAILSPPDVFSMVMMMIPMLFLYEVGVFAVGFFEKKRTEEAQI